MVPSIAGSSIDGGLGWNSTPKIVVVQRLLIRLGKRIRKLRADRAWTQEELAHRSGLNRSYMSDVECGRADVCVSTLRKLATTLGISIADLFTGVG